MKNNTLLEFIDKFNSYDEYLNYLINAPDEQFYNKAKTINTKESYENYLKEYPNGLHIKEAKNKITEFIAIAKDNEAYNKAKTINIKQSYENYLKEYPNGLNALEAKNKIEEFASKKRNKIILVIIITLSVFLILLMINQNQNQKEYEILQMKQTIQKLEKEKLEKEKFEKEKLEKEKQKKNEIYYHINTFLSEWDDAHNLKSEKLFYNVYADNLKYYNMDSASNKYVIEDKIKKLKENVDFKQSSMVFDTVKLKDNTYKVFLNKYNYFNKKSKKFNSYLVIKDIGNNKFEIIEEGDRSSKEVEIEQQNINTIKSKITELENQGFEDKGSYIIPPMVKIKAGTFQMGSNEKGTFQMGRYKYDEKPIHEVSIKNDFYMGKYEVTFAEYDKFCEDTNRKKPDDSGFGRGSKPVINVSWNDASEYAKWLSQKTGQNYKLPSETQWEYATKAGTTTKYSFGDDEKQLAQYAWYDKNSYDKGKNHSDYGTHNIGSKKPNPWGLYDVHGNVWEWVDDWYVNNYKNTPRDENSNIKGEKKYRVVRGGSWVYYAISSRTAVRSSFRPAYSGSNIGFRLSRTLP
jgi:formylglycine-generating enzyme required for sulfatase activity